MPGSHAILSPSSAERWLSCTPSARLEESFPDKSGQAAKEGTLAHSLAELMLTYRLKEINAIQYKARLRKIQADKLYQREMLDFISDYADRIIERFTTAKARTRDARIFLETKFDLTAYAPESFGTGDATIIADAILDIGDLKYGKGVPVSAEKNKQMMLYALGALLAYGFLYTINTVRMTIYQPRLDSVSTWEISVTDLLQWAEDELKPKAALAFDGLGDFNPGKHCRFCKAAGSCKANADFNMEIAKHDFADAVLLTDQAVADILQQADLFRKWLTAVEEHAREQAVKHGKQWPGLKLVEGRSDRIYTSETTVAETLIAAGIEKDTIYAPQQLLGITALEKAIGKGKFAELLTPVAVEGEPPPVKLVIKPSGKPTLVPLADKRPALNSTERAAEVFSEIEA
jgi:hypothetical protein